MSTSTGTTQSSKSSKAISFNTTETSEGSSSSCVDSEASNSIKDKGLQDSISLYENEKNRTTDKKNKCTSLLEKYTQIWAVVSTLLLLAASVICGIFLAGYISDLQKNVINLQITTSNQAATISSQSATISSQSANISSQSATISQLQQEMSELQKKTDTDVFFTARLSSRDITVPIGLTVVYDHVITSMGEGYDASSGIFQAPKSGHYWAEINAVAQRDELVNLGLQHNGDWVVAAWCDGTGGNIENSCSNSAIVRLKQGDSLRVVATSTSFLGRTFYNSFSVQLLSVDVTVV